MPATTRILALLAGCLAPALAAADDDAPAPPRYRLEVGQEIVYEVTTRIEGPGQEATSFRARRTAWVVGRSGYRSWDLIVSHEINVPRRPAGGDAPPPAPEAPADAGWAPQLVGRVVVTHEGRIHPVDLIWPGSSDPRHLFPRLPWDAPGDARGISWSSDRDAEPSWFHYERPPGPRTVDGGLAFRALRHDVPLEARLESTNARYTFGPERGLVTSFEVTSKNNALRQTSVATGRLESVNRRDAEWLGRLGRELDAHLAAVASYDAAVWAAGHDPAGPRARLAEARAGLDRARDSFTMPIIAGVVDRKLGAHAQVERDLVARSARLAGILGKPAKDWDARDAEGRQRTLADDRGKVLLVSFWGAGEPFGLEQLGRAIRVSNRFPRAAVAVVGVSTEWDHVAAARVIWALGFNGPTLRAGPEIPEAFGLGRGGGLVVIDRRGAVRAVLDDTFLDADFRNPESLVVATVRDLLIEQADD